MREVKSGSENAVELFPVRHVIVTRWARQNPADLFARTVFVRSVNRLPLLGCFEVEIHPPDSPRVDTRLRFASNGTGKLFGAATIPNRAGKLPQASHCFNRQVGFA